SVLEAIGMDGAAMVQQRGAPPGGPAGPALPTVGANRSGTYSIESLARLADGRESLLRAVVRAGGGAVPGMAYTGQDWEEGASPRWVGRGFVRVSAWAASVCAWAPGREVSCTGGALRSSGGCQTGGAVCWASTAVGCRCRSTGKRCS